MGHGHGLAVGDVNGDGAPDVYAVDGCVDRVNQPDLLLLNGGDGRTWQRLDLPALLGKALIIAGILVIHLLSDTTSHDA